MLTSGENDNRVKELEKELFEREKEIGENDSLPEYALWSPNIPLFLFSTHTTEFSPKEFGQPKVNPVDILSSKSKISGCCALFGSGISR